MFRDEKKLRNVLCSRMIGCNVFISRGTEEASHRLLPYICQIPTFNFAVSDLPKAFGTERKFPNGLINWKKGNFCSFVGTKSCVVFLREIKRDSVRVHYNSRWFESISARIRVTSLALTPHPSTCLQNYSFYVHCLSAQSYSPIQLGLCREKKVCEKRLF